MRRTCSEEVTAAGLIVWMAILPSIATGAPDALYWGKVDFYVNNGSGDTLVGSDSVPSSGYYSVTWDSRPSGFPDGTYTLKATAEDNLGNRNPDTFSITVDNTDPTASVTQPSGIDPLEDLVTISATAADNTTLGSFEIRIDNVTKVSGASPLSFIWDSKLNEIVVRQNLKHALIFKNLGSQFIP